MTRRYAAYGLLLGAAWGVLARVWMRLISTEPAFTWTGTALLVGGAGVVGLCLGLVQSARSRGGSRWWRLLYLLVLAFLAEGGPPLLAAVLLGGWTVRRGRRGRLVAALVVVATVASLTAILWDESFLGASPFPAGVYRLVAATGGLVIVTTGVLASAIVLAPWPRRAQGSVTPAEEVTAPTAA